MTSTASELTGYVTSVGKNCPSWQICGKYYEPDTIFMVQHDDLMIWSSMMI